LAPASWGRAQVHHPLDAIQHLELAVDLDQLERAPSPPALFFGQPVVYVTLVFGRLAHFTWDWSLVSRVDSAA